MIRFTKINLILETIMKKKGAVLAFVLLGVLATAAVVPFLISNTETESKNAVATDESNRIFWAADGAACDAYKKGINTLSSVNLDDLSIEKKGENLSQSNNSPIYQYNDDSFIATTTIDAQKSLHNEYACWVAEAGAENYDFKNKLKAVYVKPGVEYTNYGALVWNRNGILYKISDSNKLVKFNGIKVPVWQLNKDLALGVDGKARYIYDGTVFDDNAVFVAATGDKNYFGLNKNNKIFNSDGNVKWKSLTDNTSGELLNIVFAVGGNKHMLALASNGEVYGWGDNSRRQITQKPNKDGTVKDSFSSQEAVLISDKESIPTATSKSYVDLAPYKNTSNPIAAYLKDKYGLTPHHCRNHSEYNSSCLACRRRNTHPWGGDSLSDNCDCDLCKEVRDVTRYDNRSKHLDHCHCNLCSSSCLKGNNSYSCNCAVCKAKRQHFWTCHCNDCVKERAEAWGFDNVPSNKVPNPSTPLHLDEDTKIDNFQVMLDANSAYFSTGDFFNGLLFRSVVDFRAKLVPKNPPTNEDDPNDVGTYKNGITSDDMNNIYVIDGGQVEKDQTDFYDPLKKTWLVDFDSTLKKGNNTVSKLPKGDYEVLFESRIRFQTFSLLTWRWKDTSYYTSWERLAPFNMFFGIDPQKLEQGLKKNYYGGIFRLNDALFNLTGGKIYTDENHTVVAVAAGDTFSMLLAKNDADAKKNPNKYKLLTWGANENKQLGRKNTDSGMNEVIFAGDDKDNNNYVAKNIRSIKAGKNQALVLTDNGTNREIWTWGANTFETPVKLSLDLDSPVVSIAAGNGKNMLITEKDTVYEWAANSNSVNSNNIISK